MLTLRVDRAADRVGIHLTAAAQQTDARQREQRKSA